MADLCGTAVEAKAFGVGTEPLGAGSKGTINTTLRD